MPMVNDGVFLLSVGLIPYKIKGVPGCAMIGLRQSNLAR
jgi:hypothetical protein